MPNRSKGMKLLGLETLSGNCRSRQLTVAGAGALQAERAPEFGDLGSCCSCWERISGDVDLLESHLLLVN